MILVTGATGNVGSETVRLLAARQQFVRALVRDTSRVQPADVEVVTGDFDDPDSLDAAMRDVDTVVLVSPAIPHQEIAVIDAAARGGVTHVVKATSKASADSPVERRRGQTQIEQHLHASGLAWTLLRSNAYLQNLLALAPLLRRTSGFVMSAGDGQVVMVDARDVASVAACIATSPAHYAGATYWPTGPALITYTDVARELSTALGHPIEYRRISPDQHREMMINAGVPDAVATSNAQAFKLIAEGDAAWTTDDVETITGEAPHTLHAFITEHIEEFAEDEGLTDRDAPWRPATVRAVVVGLTECPWVLPVLAALRRGPHRRRTSLLGQVSLSLIAEKWRGGEVGGMHQDRRGWLSSARWVAKPAETAHR